MVGYEKGEMLIMNKEMNKSSGIQNVQKERVKNRWFLSYLFSNAAGGLSSPLIPLYIIFYLHLSVFYVGFASAVASTAAVPAVIFWGNLSDSIGKRKIFLMIGFFGSSLSLMMIIFVHQLFTFLGVLVVFQLISMASTPVATLLILENSQESEWPNVISQFNIVSYVGLIIGLFIGTVFLTFNSKNNGFALPFLYIFSGIVYFVAGVSVITLLKESKEKLARGDLDHINSVRLTERIRYFPTSILHIAKSSIYKSGKPLLKRTKFYIALTGLLMFGFQMFFVPYPVYIADILNGSETIIFIMYLFNNVLSALAFIFSGKFSRKYGLRYILNLSIISRVAIVFAAVFCVFYGIKELTVSVALYSIMGFFWSFISIAWVTSISKVALPENRGKAIGWYNSVLGIGQIGGAIISGIISEVFGFGYDFIISIIILIMGGILISTITPSKGSRPIENI